MKQGYLSWLAEETDSNWNNDSALSGDVARAVEQGAIGITSNPPLSYEALTTDSEIYEDGLAALDKSMPDDEYAFEAMCLVVRHYSEKLLPLHREKGTYYGCVRTQVAPNLRADAQKMLSTGKKLAAIGENVMVKIPGTKAGIWTLEELAALGIPTNPTVVTTVSQAVAAAEAYERGRDRAVQAGGFKPGWSSCAVVMGRAQDYFAALNRERSLGLSDSDLDWAALAILKRSYELYKAKGYRSILMPAAFRSARQVEQLAGGDFCATIHPRVQSSVEAADQAGTIRREILADAPVDQGTIERVSAALPEFRQAYEPDGLNVEEFDAYGAVVMTLDGFDIGGWQKLISLKTRS